MERRGCVVVGVLVATLLAAGPIAAGPAGAASGPFAGADAAMRARVRDDHLAGGVLLAARGDTVLHEKSFGTVNAHTLIPIASASKWLTSATLMTFVDEGRLVLDDPVARYLSGFTGAKHAITVRELLSHRSGLPYPACEGDPSTTMAACVRSIARGGDPTSTPGSEFHYSGVGFVVAGRIIEKLSGTSFERAFEARIAHPLGMTQTRFDGSTRPRNRNPAPAASARSTADDYARFLRMLAHDGTVDGRRVLRGSSVAEIERDQVAGLDTTGDGAVQITGIPTYGLGVWRDVVGPDDEIRVVSGSGALGFYPWIDRVHGTYGVVAVADASHGAEHAVPASQHIARLLWREAA
jgi:serine-type D-Ala-D-Ala carboxypeptidase/endopeptidase